MKVLVFEGNVPKLKKMVTFTKLRKPPKVEKLELVYTDVYGPILVSLLGGPRYYVTFIDGSIGKVWVYFLKNKSHVFMVVTILIVSLFIILPLM